MMTLLVIGDCTSNQFTSHQSQSPSAYTIMLILQNTLWYI